MKFKICFLTFALIFFSCNKNEKDTTSIINSKDLKLIQNKKAEVGRQINTLQKELTYYKDYSMSAYCWNIELMEHINNLTMTKTE